MQLVTLSGSPSTASRSGWLLRQATQRLAPLADTHHSIDLRGLPAQALLTADVRHPALRAAIEPLLEADVLVVATPIYKAAYSGLLKVFLDLLPEDALRHTTVLPLATGGSPGHLLALEYALKPVLGALGARHIADAVFGLDAQIPRQADGQFCMNDELAQRLDRAVSGVFEPRPQRVALPC